MMHSMIVMQTYLGYDATPIENLFQSDIEADEEFLQTYYLLGCNALALTSLLNPLPR